MTRSEVVGGVWTISLIGVFGLLGATEYFGCQRDVRVVERILYSHKLPPGCREIDRTSGWTDAPFGGNAEPGTAALLLECTQDETKIRAFYEPLESDVFGLDVHPVELARQKKAFWVSLYNFRDLPSTSFFSAFSRIHRKGLETP